MTSATHLTEKDIMALWSRRFYLRFTVQMGWPNFTLKLILHFSNQTKSTKLLAMEFMIKTSNTVKTFIMYVQQLIVLVNTYLYSSCSVSACPRYRSQCLSCLEQEKAINIRDMPKDVQY